MVLKVAKSSVDDNRKKPETPQIEITNNGNADKYVNGIELTFDSYFSVKGVVEIVIGDKVILDGNDAEDFRQYKLLTVPINSEILKREKSIKIYVWNPIDDDIVKITANIALEELAGNSNLSGIPSDPDVVNRHISGGSAISEDAQAIIDALGENGDDNQSSRGVVFNHQTYHNETLTELIDMAGNKNLIVTMSASDIVSPEIIDNGSFSSDAIADNDLETFSTKRISNKGVTLTYEVIADFHTLDNRTIDAKILAENVRPSSINWQPNSFSMSYEIHTSEDGANYSQDNDNTYMRYAKVIITIVIGGSQRDPAQFDLNFYEIYDTSTVGGIAYLSFEIINANGLWRTLEGMSSEDIGTLSHGGNVTKTFGAVTGLFIPSSQSLFRAKLHVSGSVTLGVSIIRGQ